MNKEKLTPDLKLSPTKSAYSKTETICEKCGQKTVFETDFVVKNTHKCKGGKK